MASPTQPDSLDALEARIAALRAARRPKRSPGADKFQNLSVAWRMVTELVVGVMLGAGIGWGLDSLAGTRPLLLIVFLLLGFAAGVRTMMRSADEIARRQRAEDDAKRRAGAADDIARRAGAATGWN